MPLAKATPETLTQIAKRVRPLRELHKDLSTFLNCDRTMPYAWANARRRPSPKATAGLALFELCRGQADKLAECDKAVMLSAIAQWLELCGYSSRNASQLLNEQLLQHRIESVPSAVLPERAYAGDLSEIIQDICRRAEAATSKHEPWFLWRVVLNRFSQEEAKQQVARWIETSKRGTVVNYTASTSRELIHLLPDGKWVADKLVSNASCDFWLFIDITDADQTPLPILRDCFANRSDLKGENFHIYERRSSSGPRPSMASWAFIGDDPEMRFGRLLLPVEGPRWDVVVNRLAPRESREEILWRYVSAPAYLAQVVAFLKSNEIMIEEEEKLPVIKPGADWKIVNHNKK